MQGADDLELAGGFAGEVEGAVEVAGAELAERELEQHAGFAEAGGGFEEDERVALKEGGEFSLRGFLAGSRRGERGPETQAAQALARAKAEFEEFDDALELCAEERVVSRRERYRLGEAALCFYETQLRAES